MPKTYISLNWTKRQMKGRVIMAINNLLPLLNRYAIRFEIGVESLQTGGENRAYFDNCIRRATTLYNHFTEEDDEVVLLYTLFQSSEEKVPQSDILLPFLDEGVPFYQFSTEANEDPEDEEVLIAHNHVKTTARNVKVDSLIKACVYREYTPLDVFFRIINLTKQVIFHVYSDDGLDISSFEEEPILDLYHSHRKWINDYDRLRIDNLLKVGLYGTAETAEEKERRIEENMSKMKTIGIYLHFVNTCHVTHTLVIPPPYLEECYEEVRQTGFSVRKEEERLFATKTQALALIDYQSELMSLYAKKYKGRYEGWESEQAFDNKE